MKCFKNTNFNHQNNYNKYRLKRLKDGNSVDACSAMQRTEADSKNENQCLCQILKRILLSMKRDTLPNKTLLVMVKDKASDAAAVSPKNLLSCLEQDDSHQHS